MKLYDGGYLMRSQTKFLLQHSRISLLPPQLKAAEGRLFYGSIHKFSTLTTIQQTYQIKKIIHMHLL